MSGVSAAEVNFIKLGSGGEWEAECLRNGTIRVGYNEIPRELCIAGNWDGVWKVWNELRGDAGTATRDTKQIRTFYESTEQCIFITFSGGLMHWCRPTGPVEVLADGGQERRTVDGWHSTSVGGKLLIVDQLSGNLLKVQMFRGTICQVKAAEYLLRKLNDKLSPEVARAEEAECSLTKALVALMRLLTWQDFELLVDLIFSNSGWRRVSVIGKTQKTVDLELLLPTTGERAFVQIKSQASSSSLHEYVNRFKESTAYDKMFFVWHSGDIGSVTAPQGVALIGPERLSRMVLDAGLSSWLRGKVS